MISIAVLTMWCVFLKKGTTQTSSWCKVALPVKYSRGYTNRDTLIDSRVVVSCITGTPVWSYRASRELYTFLLTTAPWAPLWAEPPWPILKERYRGVGLRFRVRVSCQRWVRLRGPKHE